MKAKLDIHSRLERGVKAYGKINPTVALLLRDARKMLERYRETEAQLRAALRFDRANRNGSDIPARPKTRSRPLRKGRNEA